MGAGRVEREMKGEECYPDAECTYVGHARHPLTTPTAGAFYASLPPKQVRCIVAGLEFHYAPRHGSELNQAEIEIGIVERGCLSRPVIETPTLEQRVRVLEDECNARHATIDWQFTNRQARVTPR